MKIIDAHMHFSNIETFKLSAAESGVDFSYEGYMRECAKAGIEKSICMGLAESKKNAFPDALAQNPMLWNLCDTMPEQMYICPGVNPHTLDENGVLAIENAINSVCRLVGIKIYAGYYHFDIFSEVYDPVYALALKYNLPVVIHTGDTSSDKAILSYAHPLNADRLAVKYPDLKIIVCHLGFPWIIDACEVAYKNKNVYLDMSGLIEGGSEAVEYMTGNKHIMDFHIQGLALLNNYKKILFGTDWPLTKMDLYVEFCKKLIPPYAHEEVFYYNARDIFYLR